MLIIYFNRPEESSLSSLLNSRKSEDFKYLYMKLYLYFFNYLILLFSQFYLYLKNQRKKNSCNKGLYKGNSDISNWLRLGQEINPLTPRRTLVSPFTEISILRRDHQKIKISYERHAYGVLFENGPALYFCNHIFITAHKLYNFGFRIKDTVYFFYGQ